MREKDEHGYMNSFSFIPQPKNQAPTKAAHVEVVDDCGNFITQLPFSEAEKLGLEVQDGRAIDTEGVFGYPED